MRTTNLSLTRCLGPKLLALLPCFFLFAAAGHAQTAPPTLFQLDGTATSNGNYPSCTYVVSGSPVTVPCDYWNLINGSGAGDGKPGYSLVKTFVSGEASTLSFTGGGSKDPNDLTSWACSSSPTPNKDTLTNGYAAAYSAPGGDLVTIFGADRLSTSGDANIGIWFFHENVACNAATGKFVVANPDGTLTTTAATHQNGDIFAVSAFVNGGAVPQISVYAWDNSCASGVKNPQPGDCAAANLRLKFSAGSLCDSNGTLSSETACSITNSSAITASWPYPSSSSATPSSIPAQAFFTGGVDVTSLIGGGSPCFSSFLEETRSSQTPSAVLKDFLIGGFPVCSISVSKTCTGNSLIDGGTMFEYTWNLTVKNTGAQMVTGVQVSDGVAGATVGAPTSGNPASLAPGASVVYPVTDVTALLSVTNTASATTNEITTPVGSSGGSPTCSGSASSTVSIAKYCVDPSTLGTAGALGTLSCSSSGCAVVIPWYAKVCNTGTSQLTNIQVGDYPNPGTNVGSISPTGFTLNAGDCTGQDTTTACKSNADCTTPGYTCDMTSGFCATPPNPMGSYKPTGYDSSSNGSSNGRFLFDDVAYVSSATATVGSNPTPVNGCPGGNTCVAFNGQSCPLCPTGECVVPPGL